MLLFVLHRKVPLSDKMRQRSISLEHDEDGLEGLEEPLKAKKRRESEISDSAQQQQRQGRGAGWLDEQLNADFSSFIYN